MTQRDALIFLHIPKTAGSTLHYALERLYDSGETFTIDGGRVRESIKEFVGLADEQRAKIKLLKGHMPFGLHRFLPNPSTYITVLRNPVHRMISQYYHILRLPSHYLYDEITSQEMSLEDYVGSGITTETDNGQTRLVAGELDEIGFGQCTRELLDQAIDNINNQFAVVGLSERFDETLMLLKRTLGWSEFPFYVNRNVTRERPMREEIPGYVINIINRHNQLDRELYEYARKSLEQTMQAQDHHIGKELKRFVMLNRVYQQYMRPYLFSRLICRRLKSIVSGILCRNSREFRISTNKE